MKIAICLFGYTGSNKNRENISSEFNPQLCFDANKDILYNKYDVDFFIHSWSKNFEDNLIRLYNPKKIKCEKQPSFLEIKLNDYNLDQVETYVPLIINKGNNVKNELKNLIIASNSRWTSNCKALNLMQDYAIENNCNYDLVIQMRLDLIFYKKQNLESLDKNIFYHPSRNHQKNIAINDFFFISNYENAISFSKIINNLTKLSIRPVCAAKQFLDKLNIKNREFLTLGKDFNLLRMHLANKDIPYYKKNIFYIFIKKIYYGFLKIFSS